MLLFGATLALAQSQESQSSQRQYYPDDEYGNYQTLGQRLGSLRRDLFSKKQSPPAHQHQHNSTGNGTASNKTAKPNGKSAKPETRQGPSGEFESAEQDYVPIPPPKSDMSQTTARAPKRSLPAIPPEVNDLRSARDRDDETPAALEPEDPPQTLSSRRRPPAKTSPGIVHDALAAPHRRAIEDEDQPIQRPSSRMPRSSNNSYDRETAEGRAPVSSRAAEPIQREPAQTARVESPAESKFDDTQRSAPARESADNGRLLINRKSPNINVETAGPNRIAVGREATYLITVTNTGEMSANDVIVHVDVPEWAEVTGAQSTAAGSATARLANGYQWKLPNVAPRSRQELALKIIPRKSQAFELGVRYSYTPIASQALVEVEEPKLQMAITGPDDVIFGERRIYKLTITNPGTGEASDVKLHLLPIDPSDGNGATHGIGSLPAGASKSVEIELTARQAGKISIKAEATAEGGLKSLATQLVNVRRAQLHTTFVGPKIHYAGAPASYELRVTNPGDAPAQQVDVSVVLPPDAEMIVEGSAKSRDGAANTTHWTIDTLPPGGEQKFSFKCTLRDTGANRLTATATATGDLRHMTEVSTQVLALADLALEASDGPGPLPVGQEDVYEIRIKNRGTSGAEQVEIVAFFSEGLDPIGVEGGSHEMRDGTVIFKPIGTVAAGEQVVLKIRAKATLPGNHRMRVELECKPLGVKLTSEDTTLFYGEAGAEPASR